MTVISKKDRQFMKMCIDSSKTFSTCGKKQYAAMLVDEYNHIVGFGYNGGPRGFLHCNEGGCRRFLENSKSGSAYDNCIAIHAEANALLHSDYSSQAYLIYVNGPPCFSCAKLIANSTIEHVYYLHDDNYKDWNKVNEFLQKAGVSTNVVEM